MGITTMGHTSIYEIIALINVIFNDVFSARDKADESWVYELNPIGGTRLLSISIQVDQFLGTVKTTWFIALPYHAIVYRSTDILSQIGFIVTLKYARVYPL